jgi:hypothetical protein
MAGKTVWFSVGDIRWMEIHTAEMLVTDPGYFEF